jgi:regulatory LuxR family protein
MRSAPISSEEFGSGSPAEISFATACAAVAGRPNKVIAYDLGISPRIIEIYRARVMDKMWARSLSALGAWRTVVLHFTVTADQIALELSTNAFQRHQAPLRLIKCFARSALGTLVRSFCS